VKHVLLVDDNRAFAENLAEILRDEGILATLCQTGVEALEKARQTRFDVLVTDMRMPVMSGAALVHELRRVDHDLPAIVVSAYTGESDLADARSEGLLAVLPKPVPISQLVALVRASRRGGLVVVVEDDQALADNLSEVLRQDGFAALTAGSALEAERLGDVKPFAALVDLRLPDAPRGEILGRLAKRFPGIASIIVTGHPDALPADAQHAAIFHKPFDTRRLIAELERIHAGRGA
jgi:DNA-binding NtrC family response regulator